MVHYKALFEEQLMEWCFWKDENKQKIGMFQLCRKLHNITFEKRLYDAKRSNGSANACKILMQFLFFFNTNVTTLKSWGLYIKTKKKKGRKIMKDAMTVSSSENQAISFWISCIVACNNIHKSFFLAYPNPEK